MKYKIIIASDHNGVNLKSSLVAFLRDGKYDVLDIGPNSEDESVDYPDYAKKLCDALLEKIGDLGILICGTGIGMSIAANRCSHIRAALCFDEHMAERARAHNDANVIIFGSNNTKENDAIKMLDKFIKTSFDGGRHSRRLAKIS
jgi:ribose 5-phosphate isomerase B